MLLQRSLRQTKLFSSAEMRIICLFQASIQTLVQISKFFFISVVPINFSKQIFKIQILKKSCENTSFHLLFVLLWFFRLSGFATTKRKRTGCWISLYTEKLAPLDETSVAMPGLILFVLLKSSLSIIKPPSKRVKLQLLSWYLITF